MFRLDSWKTAGRGGKHHLRGLCSLALAGLAVLGCASRASTPVHVPTDGYCSPAFQAQFGWPDPVKAARVCSCESRGNPSAWSPGGRYAGLFQFSEATWREMGGGNPFDPFVNSAHAFRLWQRRGWKPWPRCGRD